MKRYRGVLIFLAVALLGFVAAKMLQMAGGSEEEQEMPENAEMPEMPETAEAAKSTRRRAQCPHQK